MSYFIGLMSGTSIDAVDVALVDINGSQLDCVSTCSHPFPDNLRQAVVQLATAETDSIEALAVVDRQLGQLFAEAALALLRKTAVHRKKIVAIGSHGQTVRHCPNAELPFTIQLGDASTIASLTGITTVADFRRKDIAWGGQGAPLTPAFHRALLASNHERIIVNIGGIANITYLTAGNSQSVIGFDCGPGNTLLDGWSQQHIGKAYDAGGEWAAGGTINRGLLDRLLSDHFFQQPAPKSTGRDYFNPQWLTAYLKNYESNLLAQDIQATLTALTAHSIAQSVKQLKVKDAEIIVVGGGVHNSYLLQLLQQQLSPMAVHSSAICGVNPDYIEAMAFAWLAQQTLDRQPVDLTTVTGARQASVLGGIYYP